MSGNRNCCVVVPVYKKEMNHTEYLSLKQCVQILGNHPIVLVSPQSLNTEPYTRISEKILVRKFENIYFQNIEGYNKLMLSQHFYKNFTEYKYILIYQLDSWIFRDELEYWCHKDYDYIGAPWINHRWAEFTAGHLTFMRTVFYKLGYRKFNLVGNGGFSLRKVKSTISNLNFYRNAARKFRGNEDYFFSFYINSYNPFFKIPSLKEALQFSFDINPTDSFKLNGNQLPMGCHGWNKHKEFWGQFIN